MKAGIKEAIKERAIPVWTPAREEILTSEKEKWVVSITQEVVDQTGQNLGVVRLDIGYDSLLRLTWITCN